MMFGRFTERAQKVLALSKRKQFALDIVISARNISCLGL